MNEEETQQLIDLSIEASNHKAQYDISRIPAHSHNGMDSQRLDFGGSLVNRQLIVNSHVPNTGAATSGNYGHFYIHSATLPPAKIIVMSEVHGRAGNDAGVVTVKVVLLAAGDASLTGGTAIGSFNLKSAADTPVYLYSALGQTPAVIYPGARIALQTSGTLTNVADVLVTVLLQY